MACSLQKTVNGKKGAEGDSIDSLVLLKIYSLSSTSSIKYSSYSKSLYTVWLTSIVGDQRKSLWKICKTCSNTLFFFLGILVKIDNNELSGKV
jgi:hypothetical protein